MSDLFNRDAARRVLFDASSVYGADPVDVMLDRLAACVLPAAVLFDRAAAEEILVTVGMPVVGAPGAPVVDDALLDDLAACVLPDPRLTALAPADLTITVLALRQWARSVQRAYDALDVASSWAADATALADRLEAAQQALDVRLLDGS